MPHWTPCKRNEVIRRLRRLGFNGPHAGRRHDFMLYGKARQTLPSHTEYSVPMLRSLLKQIEALIGRPIAKEEWDGLGRS